MMALRLPGPPPTISISRMTTHKGNMKIFASCHQICAPAVTQSEEADEAFKNVPNMSTAPRRAMPSRIDTRSGHANMLGSSQIKRPSLRAHSSGKRAPFFRLQLRQDPSKLEAAWGPPLDRGMMWSKCQFFLIGVRHQPQRNFCRDKIAARPAFATPIGAFRRLRSLCAAACTRAASGLAARHWRFLSTFCALCRSRHAFWPAFCFSGFSAKYFRLFAMLHSGLALYHSALRATKHVTHPPFEVNRGDMCPYLHGTAVKNLRQPSVRASLRLLGSGISGIVNSVIRGPELWWREASYALPGAAALRHSSRVSLATQGVV